MIHCQKDLTNKTKANATRAKFIKVLYELFSDLEGITGIFLLES
jgi:hypothetical protein